MGKIDFMKKIVFMVFFTFLLDIFSKLFISGGLKVGESVEIIDDFLYLTYVKNTGVAFSFLEGNRFFIIIMSFLILGMILNYIFHHKLNALDSIGFGLVLGGAFGNLFDRMIYGYVIDFIDVYIFSYDYPVFNIADIGVVVGVIILCISSLKEEMRKKD